MARILVVDDERPIRVTLGEFLRREGRETETAGDVESAWELLRAQPFDVVVTDIVLPGGSGIELARRIREEQPDVQVIVMTAMPGVESAVEAVRSGAFDYLIKPVTRGAILRTVDNALRLKEVADERARLAAENRRYQASLEALVGERTAALEAEIAERCRVEAALRRAVGRLEGLRAIDRAILEAESSLEVVQVAIRHLRRLSRCWQVAVALFDWDGQAVRVMSCQVDGEQHDHADLTLPLSEYPIPDPVRRGEVFRAEDLGAIADLSPWQRTLLAQGVRSVVVLPLHIQGTLLGLLVLRAPEPGPFPDEEVEIAREVADQLSIGLRQAQLSERIRAHSWELELTVTERTAALELANRKLEAASKAKSEFLANMSHELRTPLNGILGFSQLLLEQAGKLPLDRQTRYAQHILRSGEHLLQLINDILDLSKVEAGKIVLQPSPQRLPELLEDVLVIVRGLANKKSQRLEVALAPDLAPLHADPVRLKQVCYNLLSNAVKFTPAGGAVTVTARRIADCRLQNAELGATEAAAGSGDIAECGMRNAQLEGRDPAAQSAICNLQSAIPGDWLELSVSDTGAGIRPEDLPRLFQEFVQLDTTAAQHGEGTGLGLALTRRLVELHGGTIRVESTGEGQGSTFTVRLPMAGQPAGDGRQEAAGGG